MGGPFGGEQMRLGSDAKPAYKAGKRPPAGLDEQAMREPDAGVTPTVKAPKAPYTRFGCPISLHYWT
jgi:hypothetical protein